jgi:DNA-binding XRE family transcriptional regulator
VSVTETLPRGILYHMNVEVRATGLRAMREKHKLTQRELARRLSVTQNYIPALEAGTRNPGPKLRQSLMQLFQCDFEDLFQVVMVNPTNNREQVLKPVEGSHAEAI